MSFIDDLGRSVGEVTRKTVEKSKEIACTAKLNYEISAKSDALDKAYIELGKRYYDTHKSSVPQDCAALFRAIEKARFELDDLKEKLNKAKKLGSCPFCKAAVEKDSVFCKNCGAQIK